MPAAQVARRRLPAAVLASVLAVSALGAVGPAVDRSQPSVTAVVSLTSGHSVTVPGIDLIRMLPAVHLEVVRASRSALSALSRVAGVIGISQDRPVHLQAKAYGGDPIYASQTVPGISSTTGKGVSVAVIDTGVSDTGALNRESGRLVDGVDTSGLSDPQGGVRDSGTFTDGYGHGTYVASLIAGGAVPGSDGATIGVAPGADVVVVKVADDRGRTSLASVVAGLNWVATHSHDIQVANLSLSVDRPTDGYGADPLNLAVRMTRDEGVTVVVAAGNTAGVVSDPGFDPAAFTVGAYDTTTNAVASFSGSGTVAGISKPDVVAAGVHVTGLVPADSLVGRTNSQVATPDGDGDLLIPGTGTSGATAIVSGIAAGFLAQHADTSSVKLSPADVAASIRQAASHVQDLRAGAGLVAPPSTLVLGDDGAYPSGWDATKAAWPDEFWQDELWTTRSWTNGSWSTRTWTTRSWTTRSWTTRSWTTRSWTTRSWTTRSWTEGPWSVSGWGNS